jgi:hypothetical protein
MAFMVSGKRIYVSHINNKLVFDIYLPETCNELIGVPVNLYKANNKILRFIADELNIAAFDNMNKRDLVREIKPYMYFVIPEHLMQYYDTSNILERYTEIQQLYIPLEWQDLDGGSAEYKFRICNTPDPEHMAPGYVVQWFTYPFTKNKVSVLRGLCDYIGIYNSPDLTKNELIEVLEEKVVFQERSS